MNMYEYKNDYDFNRIKNKSQRNDKAYLLLLRGFLIGEHGEVLEGDAFLALKLLIGEPPISPAFPANGRYRLDNALLRLLRPPWRCFVACNAFDEDKFEP